MRTRDVEPIGLSAEAAPTARYTTEGDLQPMPGELHPQHSGQFDGIMVHGAGHALDQSASMQRELYHRVHEHMVRHQSYEPDAYQQQQQRFHQQYQQEHLQQQHLEHQHALLQQLPHPTIAQHHQQLAQQYGVVAPTGPPSPTSMMPSYAFAPLMHAMPPEAPSPLPPRAALFSLQLNASDNVGNQLIHPPPKPNCYAPVVESLVSPTLPEYLNYYQAAAPPTAFSPLLPSSLPEVTHYHAGADHDSVTSVAQQHLRLRQQLQHQQPQQVELYEHQTFDYPVATRQVYQQEPQQVVGQYLTRGNVRQNLGTQPRTSNAGSTYSTKKTAYYMEAGDPNPVLIIPPSPSHMLAPAAARYGYVGANPGTPYGVSIAIVSMVKSPSNFETWLMHHHQTLGVQRFYIRVEDTPSLEPLLRSPPWNTLVEATFSCANERDYFEQMDRQSAHIAQAIPAARAAGFTHLLHIDDDELIYCAGGASALMHELATADPSRPDLHLQNVEALLPSPTCANPFAQACVFRHHPTKYCSYTNGKSLGLLSASGLRSHGPHHFRCANGSGGAHARVTHMVPAGIAVVLHFESATFARWRKKYVDLARRHGDSPEVFSRVPFRFYRESFTGALALIRAEAATAVGAPGAEHARIAAEEAAFEIWCRWKLEPAGLPAPPPCGQPPIILPQGVTLLTPLPKQPTAGTIDHSVAGSHVER